MPIAYAPQFQPQPDVVPANPEDDEARRNLDQFMQDFMASLEFVGGPHLPATGTMQLAPEILDELKQLPLKPQMVHSSEGLPNPFKNQWNAPFITSEWSEPLSGGSLAQRVEQLAEQKAPSVMAGLAKYVHGGRAEEVLKAPIDELSWVQQLSKVAHDRLGIPAILGRVAESNPNFRQPFWEGMSWSDNPEYLLGRAMVKAPKSAKLEEFFKGADYVPGIGKPPTSYRNVMKDYYTKEPLPDNFWELMLDYLRPNEILTSYKALPRMFGTFPNEHEYIKLPQHLTDLLEQASGWLR